MDESLRTQVKKICGIIEERDNILLQKGVKIKYYKDATEAAKRETKELEKASKRIAEEDKAAEKELEQLKLIRNSVRESQEIATRSLIKHQTLERMMAKELAAEQNQTQQVRDEFRTIYNESKTKLTEDPRYKKLEEARVAFLREDIQERILKVEILKREKIIEKRAEIQKKIFYNFFVKMAENYVKNKKITEVQKMKMQELEAIKKLYILQENNKMRQKLGTPKDKFKSMTNIIFGSQDNHAEKSVTKPEPPPPQKVAPQSLNEKLTNVFQQDEPKQVVAAAPQKVRIIEQKIVVPAFVAPQNPLCEKRKIKTIDLSKKWQKMIKSNGSKSGISSNQQYDKCSQLSKQSQLSQQSQLTRQSQLSMKSQESQHEFATLDSSLVNKSLEPVMENDASIQYTHDTQQLTLAQTMETCPVQPRIERGLNQGDELILGQTPQPSFTTYADQPIPTTGIMKHRPILSPSDTRVIPQFKPRVTPKMMVSEPSKMVRFNLEQTDAFLPKESKGSFGDSLYERPHFDFFAQNTGGQQFAQNNTLDQAPTLNSSFNMNRTGEDPHNIMEFTDGGSHEYSYAVEGSEEPPLGAAEMPFGQGGGFSFDTKSVFTFH